MTLRQYLSSMGIATLAVWGMAVTILLSVNPLTAPPVVSEAFYLTLFLALSGTFALVGFVMRTGILGKSDVISRQVFVAFRQAMLLSALAVVLLFLRSRDSLNWRTVLIALVVLTAIEILAISARSRRS